MVNDIHIGLTAYNPYSVLFETNKGPVNDTVLNKVLPHHSDDAVTFTKTSIDGVEFTADKILEKINQKFREKYGIGETEDVEDEFANIDEGIKNSVDNMMVAFASLYVRYQTGREDKDSEEVLNSFMKALRQGVNEGYEDALGILKANNNYGDEVQNRVKTFMDYLYKKLDDFEEEKRISFTKKEEVVE